MRKKTFSLEKEKEKTAETHPCDKTSRALLKKKKTFSLAIINT